MKTYGRTIVFTAEKFGICIIFNLVFLIIYLLQIIFGDILDAVYKMLEMSKLLATLL